MNSVAIVTAVLLATTLVTALPTGTEYDMYGEYPTATDPPEKDKPKTKDVTSLLKRAVGLGNGTENSMFLDIGIRQDYLIQRCDGNSLKYSFPNVDYALLGYDLIRGYPMAIGSDPGFTYPIFTADYTEHEHTADCRYSVPRGLVLLPDVSCVVSFSSTVVKSSREFEQSLAVSANVAAGGWGVQFSASAGYQKASSEIAKGEFVYIFSKATCNYYKSKIQNGKTPPLDPTFLHWVHKLNNTDSVGDYLDFFSKYGTHYPTQITFGSRFTKQHRMSKSEYSKKESSGVNVAVQASYSGLFSAGGGFSLDSSQRSEASSFSKSVQTTTITVGAAPPSNGDATTWASSVQSNPVPAEYQLDDIENVFSKEYMGDLDVDYQRIHDKIALNKFVYWGMMQRSKGADDFNFDLKTGIVIPNWKVDGKFKDIHVTFSDCVQTCFKLGAKKCSGVSFCKNCIQRSKSICSIFHQTRNMGEFEFDLGWQTIVFNGKLTLNNRIISDTSGDPLETQISAIGTDSQSYGRAVDQCGKALKRNRDAKSYSFGMAFDQEFLLCKIYGNTKSLSLEARRGYTTYIEV